MLRKELNIFSFNDLLNHFPYRHVDKTRVDAIASIKPSLDYAYVAGTLVSLELITSGKARRLVGMLKDDTGIVELVWFQGIAWMQKILHTGHKYFVFGKPGFFMGKPQMAHPDIENFSMEQSGGKAWLEPVYPSTDAVSF